MRRFAHPLGPNRPNNPGGGSIINPNNCQQSCLQAQGESPSQLRNAHILAPSRGHLLLPLLGSCAYCIRRRT